jgi:MFS family permease
VAPLLTVINADIGPDPNVVWVPLSYLLTLTVFLAPVGRLTDIFGRRWFFISFSLIGTVGTIVGATAQNVPQLIGGFVLIGASAGAGFLSFGSCLSLFL